MTLDITLAGTRTSGGKDANETFSAAWWQARTAEELRDIIKRGFAGGDTFQAAVTESERRARDATRRLREAATEAKSRRKRMKLMIIGGFVSVATIALSTGIWFAA